MKNIIPKMLPVVMCVIALNVFAAAQKPTPSPTPERPREIVALLNDARLAAPELAVDTFLKVVESKKVTDPVWKKEILDEGLRMLDDVKNPVQLMPVQIKGFSIESGQTGMIGLAHQQKLDRLSLRGRIIRAILAIDHERAKQLIFQIGGQLSLKPRTCQDSLTYEVGDIYAVAGDVAKAVFSEKEVGEGLRALYLLPWFENIESPVQLGPALKMFDNLKGSANERQILFGAFARAMNRDFKDDRSFTHAVVNDFHMEIIPDKNTNDSYASEIFPLYRSFLVKNLRGTRCKDNEIKKGEEGSEGDSITFYMINNIFRQNQLTEDELTASDFAGTVKNDDFRVKSSDVAEITRELQSLRGVGADGKTVSIDKADVEWQSRVGTFADKIPSWQPNGELSASEVFHLRQVIFTSLLQSIPTGDFKKSVMRKYIRGLATASVQKDNFIEWYFYVLMVTKLSPNEFVDIAAEFPNPNFKVLLGEQKLFGGPTKESPKPTPTPTPERPREIVALLNDARLAAPELAVDTFLKVVESKKVTDPVWRKEIIDEALRMIDDVQYPMPMRPGYGGSVEANNKLQGTEDFLLVFAHSAKLDRLSFKGRVITLLLETDRERAKQMIFQMGGDFGLKPRSCEDALTYSPDGMYTVVAKVAKAVFTEQQIAGGQRALLVAPWIENIESPRQIYPALDLLQQMQGSQAERQMLFNAASRAIDRNFKDDRSFTYGWDSITVKVGKLIDGESDPLKSELKSAFRGMLLKNLRGTRCKDNEIKKDEPLPDYIEAANKLFPENPLTFEDVSTSDFGGTVKVTNLLKKSSAAPKFREELMAVRDQKVVDNQVVNHDVNDVAWGARVNEYVEHVLSFEGVDNETEGEMLFLKAGMVGAMMSGVGPGELRKTVLRKYLRLLAGSRLQKTNFIEWRFWIADAERMDPESFYEIASEFPNPNLKVMAAAKKLLEEPKKETPKPTPTPTPKP